MQTLTKVQMALVSGGALSLPPSGSPASLPYKLPIAFPKPNPPFQGGPIQAPTGF